MSIGPVWQEKVMQWRCISIGLIALVASLTAMPGAGQIPAPAGPKADEAAGERPLTAEIVETRRQQAEASAELDEATKKRIVGLYAQATEALKSAAEAAERAKIFQRDAESVPARLREVQAQIAARRGLTPAVPDTTEPSDLEGELVQADRVLADLKQAQARAENDRLSRANRRKDVRNLLFSAPQRLQEVDKQLASPTPADEPPHVTLARRTELQARRQAIEREIPAHQSELAKYDAEDAVDLLRFEQDLQGQELAFAERRFKLLDDRVKQTRQDAASEAVRRAEEESIRAQPLLKDHAARNMELTHRTQSLAQLIGQTDLALRDAESQLATVQQEFKRAQDREASVGLTKTVGAQLRKQETTLPDVRKLRRDLRRRQQTIEDIRYELFELEEERNALAKREEIVAGILRSAPPGLTWADQQDLQTAAERVLGRKRAYLDALIRSQQTYFDKLTELDTTELQLANLTQEFISYIRERVLWIRTGKPLSADLSISDSDLWLIQPGQWLSLGSQLWSEVRAAPNLFAAAVLIFSGLLAVRRRMRRKIQDLGQLAERRNCTHFRLTLQAAALTLLISLLWPAATAFLSWRLAPTPDGTDLSSAVAAALWLVAGAFLPVELLRQICRRQGLAESHFGWPISAVRTLRVNLRQLMSLGLPLVFVTSVLHASNPDQGYDVVKRIGFILTCILAAFFLSRVVHPATGMFQEYVAFHQNGWLDRLKYVWYWMGVASPLALAGIAFWGYYYSARQLAWCLLLTISLGLLLVTVRAFLLRLLLVHRRHLSIQQAQERRAAAQAAAAAQGTGAVAVSRPMIPVEEETVDLAHLSSQTQRIVTTMIVAATLIGTWAIWVDVVPALNVLDRWGLWTTVQQVTESTSDAAGETVMVTRDVIRQVTMADLLLVSVIGVITMVAFRNIPGLLEIAVLQRLPLEASARYAVTTLASYAIILIGVVWGAGTMGLRWNQIQWLATALTFGLAFGLQEIFANFVAGLIILFERPLRVGDIVTVDDVTGVVSRVRIRATTITNWDRKEFVVPNKEFITGKLLNWTLSDQMNRIVINVGIAYGSDTETARNLLLKIARNHPLLLTDPAPAACFEAFGDSSLSLVLRAFLPTFENRLNVIHELHTAIHREFASAGIEIPFPQRDLHVRSIGSDCRLGVSQPLVRNPPPEPGADSE
jgi:potassium efflux system protein